MIRRLAVVIRAWTTRRLLWVWAFAYVCVLTSACFWPVSPRDTYFECPQWTLPREVTNPGAFSRGRNDDAGLIAHLGVRALVVRRERYQPPDVEVEEWRAARRQMPSLETVFVGDYHNDPVGFRRLCETLPDIRMWHLDLNGGRLASTVFLLLATLILGGAVMQQASATLSVPQVRIYPRFAVPHLIVPLAICGAGIAVASFIAGGYGTDFWAAASIQAIGWGIWGALEFLSVRSRQNLSHSRIIAGPQPGTVATTEVRARWIEGIALVVAIGAVYLIFIARPYVLESFLLGELPWLNAGFFAIGAALGGAAIALAPTFAVELNEAGIAPVLSMQDLEKRRPPPILIAPFRRRLGHLRRPTHSQTWWWRLHAMQSGNPDLLMPVLIKIVGPVLVVVVCERFFPSRMFARAFLILLLAGGWLAVLSSCFSTWWQRRKAFSVQLLYPWTRGQMTRSAFAAYALDAAGLPALFCATAVACNGALGWGLGSRVLLTGVAVAIGTLPLLVTGGLWLLTVRHRLLASFLAIVGVTLLIAWICVAWRTLMWMDTRYLLSVGVLPAVMTAFLLASIAYRRWMNSEWGLFGPS